MNNIKDKISAYSKFFNSKLPKYFPLPKGAEKKVVEAMFYSISNGGKRLRPFLVSETAKLFGISSEQSLNVAASLEMLHSYSLVHDDLPSMDNDDLRRGKPTCHKQFDEATAVLAGDGLLTYAFELLSAEKNCAKLVRLLGQAAGAFSGMIAGQMLDLLSDEIELNFSETNRSSSRSTNLLSENNKFLLFSSAKSSEHLAKQGSDSDHSEARCRRECTQKIHEHLSTGKERQMSSKIERIEEMKTGRLIRYACEAGAVLGDASEEQTTALITYSRNIGAAFQIADDILDVEGNQELMGKTLHKDEAQGKITFVSLYGLEKAKEIARHLVEKAKSSLDIFGEKANTLKLLADFMIERNS